jgi:hypothetical protein
MGSGLGLGRMLSTSVVALLAAGCVAGSPSSSSVAGVSRGGGVAAPPTTSSPGAPAGMSFGPVVSMVRPTGHYTVATGGAATDGDDGTDLVWLDFTGGSPRCVGVYVDPPIVEDITNDVIPVKGRAFLRVSCSPVDAVSMPPALDDDQGAVYDPGFAVYRFGSGGARNVLEGVQTGFNDGVFTWTIGLRHVAPFAIGWVGQDDGNGRQTARVVILQ